MLKQRLLLSALAFVGLIAVSAVAQNPGDPANIANIPNIMDNQKCPCEMDNQKCPLCECVSTSARGPCSKWWKWSPNQVSSPEWYQNGHFDPAKRTEQLAKRLKLTVDQQSQMLDILESTKSQLEAARSDRSLSRKVRNCKLALIRQASIDQISAFLEKKQNTTFFGYGPRTRLAAQPRSGKADCALSVEIGVPQVSPFLRDLGSHGPSLAHLNGFQPARGDYFRMVSLAATGYAAFFSPALTFAHRARCAAAILFLPAADIVCLGFVLLA